MRQAIPGMLIGCFLLLAAGCSINPLALVGMTPQGQIQISPEEALNTLKPVFYNQSYLQRLAQMGLKVRGGYSGVLPQDVNVRCINTVTRDTAVRGLKSNDTYGGTSDYAYSYRRETPLSCYNGLNFQR